MNGTEWMVVIGGAGAIAWVNWYFFLAQRATQRATAGATTSAAAQGRNDGHDATHG